MAVRFIVTELSPSGEDFPSDGTADVWVISDYDEPLPIDAGFTVPFGVAEDDRAAVAQAIEAVGLLLSRFADAIQDGMREAIGETTRSKPTIH